MTKTELWNNVQKSVGALLETSKTSKKFNEELLLLLEAQLAPKSGGSSINPPKLDEDGNIVEAWCRFHERYEHVNDMVLSNGKSKGYCRASISLWNKTQSNIKKLESRAVDAMTSGDFDKAQELAKEAKDLKDIFNKPEFYDYDRDWDNLSN